MISLDNAKRLKELGLKWEPIRGDHYHVRGYQQADYRVLQYCRENQIPTFTRKYLWLPTLSQLLEEIEKRGYIWRLEFSAELKSGEREYEFWYESDEKYPHEWELAHTPDDAVALALISILEEKA